VSCGFFAVEFLMRIMAGNACHPALQKAGGFPELVCLMHYLERFAISGSVRAIEKQLVICKRLTGPE
jgi:hypothetical protein